MVFLPVFLAKIQGIVKVLDRLSRVVSCLIAFPVQKGLVSVVLAPVIKYLLCFPFFCIIDINGAGFVYPSECKSIGVILIICFEGGDLKVWLLSGHAAG